MGLWPWPCPSALAHGASQKAPLPQLLAFQATWDPSPPRGTHLWVRTAWRSRVCGRRASRRARQRGWVRARSQDAARLPRADLTSAWPPGVSVLLQRSHLRQNLCQSLPRELTFSAAGGRGSGQSPALPFLARTFQAPPGCPLQGSKLSRLPAQGNSTPGPGPALPPGPCHL